MIQPSVAVGRLGQTVDVCTSEGQHPRHRRVHRFPERLDLEDGRPTILALRPTISEYTTGLDRALSGTESSTAFWRKAGCPTPPRLQTRAVAQRSEHRWTTPDSAGAKEAPTDASYTNVRILIESWRRFEASLENANGWPRETNGHRRPDGPRCIWRSACLRVLDGPGSRPTCRTC